MVSSLWGVISSGPTLSDFRGEAVGLRRSSVAMRAAWLGALLLALAALAASSPEEAPEVDVPGVMSKKGLVISRCMACGLLMHALGDALDKTRGTLDAFKTAKEEAIGRVQKAQTRRWLKQEYGSTLYAGVDDALDKVCALPALGGHVGECESIREDNEDAIVRATLDGSAEAFCTSAVQGCSASLVKHLLDASARKPPPRSPSPSPPPAAKPARAARSPPAVLRIGAAPSAWEELVLDSERDVLVYAHGGGSAGAAGEAEGEGAAVAAGKGGGSAHKGAPLWAAFEALAKAVRTDGNLNGTLRCTRLDTRVQQVRWPDTLFDGEGDGASCLPAAVLYAASAKEKPRALLTSCTGEAGGEAGEGGEALERHAARLVEGLRTYATASSKAHVAALTEKVAAAARAAAPKPRAAGAGKQEL